MLSVVTAVNFIIRSDRRSFPELCTGKEGAATEPTFEQERAEATAAD